MKKVGMMQGRLTPPKGRGIQFFPFEEWKDEFSKAEEIGIDEIEWIFDYPDYQRNPLWSEEGQEEICKVIRETGVKVHSICWDYFMRRPFYKQDNSEEAAFLEENKKIMMKTLEAMNKIGAGLIEIPMVDSSSVQPEEESKAINFVRWSCDAAQRFHIKVGLETDFAPGKFCSFLDEVNRENVVANYDSGNSSGLGYDHREELLSLNKYVYNVHIKDRVKGNGTVKLGTGSADFDQVFKALKEIHYSNNFILQAARGEEGNEKENIMEQIIFVNEYISKYK